MTPICFNAVFKAMTPLRKLLEQYAEESELLDGMIHVLGAVEFYDKRLAVISAETVAQIDRLDVKLQHLRHMLRCPISTKPQLI